MTKPGDFLLGVLDFFAILLPGAIATWLLAQYLPEDMVRFVDLARSGGDPDRVVRWAVFLFGAYMLGHFVFMIGSRLDPTYDCWRRRRRTKPTDSDVTFEAADRLRKEVTPRLASGDFSTLKWTRSYIQIHSPQSRLEIERLEADSKFFRSLVVISAALTAHSLLHEQEWALAVGALLLGVLSYVRYAEQRWKATELSYGTAVILHATTAGKTNPAAGSGAVSESGK